MARPRKTGARFPSGKLKPETAPPAQVRRIIDEAKRNARDPLLGSEIGRLRLTDVLTDRQAAAGMRFAAVVGLYERLKGLPRRSAKSPSYELGFGSAGPGEKLDDEIIEALNQTQGDVAFVAKSSDIVRAVVRAERRYRDAQGALAAAGLRAVKVVVAVAVDDEIVVSGQHGDLQRGLDALAAHFQLTGQFAG